MSNDDLFRKLVSAGLQLRSTAIVDDDFPACINAFDTLLHAANDQLAQAKPIDAGGRMFDLIRQELDRAYAKHGKEPWSRHEFYGILKEEVDELWEAIKDDAPQRPLLQELVQVAAMCFRYFETGDRCRGPHPAI